MDFVYVITGLEYYILSDRIKVIYCDHEIELYREAIDLKFKMMGFV